MSQESLDYREVKVWACQFLHRRQQLIFLLEVKPPLSNLNSEWKVLWFPSLQDLRPAVPQINSHSGQRVWWSIKAYRATFFFPLTIPSDGTNSYCGNYSWSKPQRLQQSNKGNIWQTIGHILTDHILEELCEKQIVTDYVSAIVL